MTTRNSEESDPQGPDYCNSPYGEAGGTTSGPGTYQNTNPNACALSAGPFVLEQEIAELKSEQRQLLERYIGLEEQNSALATLYVACQRLHSTMDREEVLLTVREIITNLIGCEEYVLFDLTPDGWLTRVDSFGLPAELYERLPPGAGLIGRVIKTGEPYVADERDTSHPAPLETNLTACIPLKRNGAVTGAIALFRLLPQKFQLQELDRELFWLLETHLAIALYCTELQQRTSTRIGVTA